MKRVKEIRTAGRIKAEQRDAIRPGTDLQIGYQYHPPKKTLRQKWREIRRILRGDERQPLDVRGIQGIPSDRPGTDQDAGEA